MSKSFLRRLATLAVAAGLAGAGFTAATASTGATTTTRAPARKHQQKRTLPAATVTPASPDFPRWVIAGFVLAGVLIVSGLAGFVYTRSRP